MVPNPLASVLKRHCNVNGFVKDWPQFLVEELANHNNPEHAMAFKEQLFNAIVKRSIGIEEYEKLTGEDFDSEDALVAWLRELWIILYGDFEPPYNI